jgi:hypothetical protein
MRNYPKVLVLTVCCCVAFSCSSTNKSNPVFSKYPPEHPAYKTELIKHLALPSNANTIYHLEKYLVEDGTEKLYVAVKGDNLNATAILILDTSNAVLDGLRAKKGISYNGAELKNLQYAVKGNELFFVHADKIVD